MACFIHSSGVCLITTIEVTRNTEDQQRFCISTLLIIVLLDILRLKNSKLASVYTGLPGELVITVRPNNQARGMCLLENCKGCC